MKPGAIHTVLLVDDEPLLRQALREALAGHGFDVLEASSAFEAAALVDRRRPDVVVLDTRLPDADGVWAMRDIRHRYPEIAVVMMAAFLTSDQEQLLLDEGANACLAKNAPFSLWGRTVTTVLDPLAASTQSATAGLPAEGPVAQVIPVAAAEP